MNIKLKCKRQQRGLTQAQVAKMVGVSELAYQRYEYGMRTPNATKSILIAEALGITSFEEFKDLFEAATSDGTPQLDSDSTQNTTSKE